MKAKICIVSLLKKRKSWAHIHARNKLIQDNIGSFDMLIFDDGSYTKNDIFELSSSYPKTKFISIKKIWRKRNITHLFSKNLNYKNMCNFFALDIWEYVNNYDYMIRLDDDSLINTSIKEFISELDKNKFDSVYVRRKVDTDVLTQETYGEFIKKFFNRNDLLGELSTKNFYNNFQIVNVNFFKKPEVRNFLNEVRKTDNIYKLRWGDSNIWSSVMHFFGGKVCLLKNFDYTHQSHQYRSIPNPKHEWDYRESPLIKHSLIELNSKINT